MRVAAQVAVVYGLAVLLGAVWRILPFAVIAPAPAVVLAFYLGMRGGSSLAGATAGAVAAGYLLDVLAGAPPGLSSLVLGATTVLCRLASARLIVRGRLIIAASAFVVALAAALLGLAARAILGGPVGDLGLEASVAGGCALLTAIAAPALFRLFRLVDARFARTEREREAAREGYLG